MAAEGQLAIRNGSKFILTFTVPMNEPWQGCCDHPQPGDSVTNVPPGTTSQSFMFTKTGGHGCNGKQGQFSMVPSIPTYPAQWQGFWFNSDANLALQGNPPNYVSQLSKGDDGVYLWTVIPTGS